MDRALVFGTRGCGFESCQAHILNQSVSLLAELPLVESPIGLQTTQYLFICLVPLITIKLELFHMKLFSDNDIPKYVRDTIETMQSSGFEAFIVGGCVRDLILGRKPKDWDITTNANPEKIIDLFDHTVYENNFGTVAVVIDEVGDNVTQETSNNATSSNVTRETPRNDAVLNVTRETIQNIVEITPYRIEGQYTDNRRPDEVTFSKNIDDDLNRRDFTMNAIAYDIHKGHIIDPYKGQQDIKDVTIRAVGNPAARFQEDALRLLRAIRFSTELNFQIEKDTEQALIENSGLLKNISSERIRDEFTKIMLSDFPERGIWLLEKYGLMRFVIPEILDGIGCLQKGAHIYDVHDHLLAALAHAAAKKWPLKIRLAAVLHDIGKPKTRRYDAKKDKYTFFGHEVVGARMAKKILERLRFSHEIIDEVTNLVRYHMFFSDTEKITLSAVRRLVRNIGTDHIWELMQIRECDRAGMEKSEAPYRLRKYHAMIDEALRSPLAVDMLKLDGTRLIEMGQKPGPKFGYALHALLEEVLDEPTKNNTEYLEERVKELLALPLDELKKLGDAGKEKKEQTEEEEVVELRRKHGVK